MDFVTPTIALGNIHEAADAGLRRRHGIEAVLSLSAVEFKAGPHHAVIPVQDRVPLDPAAISRITGFIHRQVSDRRKVLVHCQMGISRSPALAACYLHEYEGISLAEAFAYVRIARPCAEPHPALLASIHAHYVAASIPEERP